MKRYLRSFQFALFITLFSVQFTYANIYFDTGNGTDAPDPTLGGLPMSAFEEDISGLLADYTSKDVPDCPGETVDFSIPMQKFEVGGIPWGTWSHPGYTGEVYWTKGESSVTLTMPASTYAFYFYAEPNDIIGAVTYKIEAIASDGTSSGPIDVVGGGGATFFGFYSDKNSCPLETITITIDDPQANGFGIGEFGIYKGLLDPTSPPVCTSALNVGVTSEGKAEIPVSQIVSNIDAYPLDITIEDQDGNIIATYIGLEPDAVIVIDDVCGLGNLKLNVSNPFSVCWTLVTFPTKFPPILECKVDTTVYCTSDLLNKNVLEINAKGQWVYPDLVPDVYIPCAETPSPSELIRRFDFSYNDWVHNINCVEDNDTAKIVYREWTTYTSSGTRSVCMDTIVVFKLPELTAENFYAPQKDTIYCVVDSVELLRPKSGPCWKILVGLHSDNKKLVHYPVAETDAIALIDSETPVIKTAGGLVYTAGDIAGAALVELNGVAYYEIEVFLNDQILSTDQTYIKVDKDWNYEAGSHGSWYDICLPGGTDTVIIAVDDRWESGGCGPQLVLPVSPTSQECDTICLNDVDWANSGCQMIVNLRTETLQEGCPRIDKCYATIKQLCFGTAVNGCVTDKFDGVTATTSGVFEIEQWKMYSDTIGPVGLSTRPAQLYYTSGHDCFANAYASTVYFKDRCSGVKSVIAFIDGVGVQTMEKTGTGDVELTNGKVEFDIWNVKDGQRPFKLACGGPYEISYVGYDNCGNPSDTIYSQIQVRDGTNPIAISDKNLNLTLTSKEVWANADEFDEGSTDNCGIRHLLVRRLDWATACGVNYCDNKTNNVEEYYAETLEWLENDGEACTSEVVNGWKNAIAKYKADNCGTVDEHGLPTGDYNSVGLGGGWAKAVPFCCEDACKEVVVELLVIDKGCNWSKSWTTVTVEDKAVISKACEFDPINISCTAFNTLGYNGYIDAVKGTTSADNPEAYSRLGESLGFLIKGWRGDDGSLVDVSGNVIDKEITYSDIEVEYEMSVDKIATTEHDGTTGWLYDTTWTPVLKNITKKSKAGGVFVLCDATCVEDIWDSRNDCGVGTITRRWKVYSGCGDNVSDEPLVFTQVINVSAGGTLDERMFTGVSDTTICAPLSYGPDGNVDIDAGMIEYMLEDTDCRQLGINYADKVFEVQGSDSKYKIHREYEISDWCSGENLYFTQKIILDKSCNADNSKLLVSGVIKTPHSGKIQKVDVNAIFTDGTQTSYQTNLSGMYQLNGKNGQDVIITPVKDINPDNGVNIADMLTISRHVLKQSLITEKYQSVAADVNNDGTISASDILAMKRVSLRKDNSFPNNTSWRFFSEDTGEESLKINISNESVTSDFIGVKIGDVNQDANLARSYDSQIVTFKDANLSKGDKVDFTLQSDDVDAYQFAIKYDPAFVEISMRGINDENYNKVAPGLIRVMSLDNLSDLVIEVTALKATSLNKSLSLGSDSGYQSLGSVNGDIKELEFAIAPNDGFALYSVSPNPVQDRVLIGFTLPEAGEATLNIIDATGKTVKSITKVYNKGYNKEELNVRELGSSGVVLYQLQSKNNLATDKFVIVK